MFELVYNRLIMLVISFGLFAALAVPLSQAQSQPADLQTLHINPQAANANDSNDGSEARPLKTIAGAFEKMIPYRQ
jgi:hypothetical protein